MSAVATPLLEPGLPIGARIAAYREYRRLSQEACAGLSGKPLPWWKKVEQGVQHVDRLADMILIARVLGVRDLTDLLGLHEFGLGLDHRDHPKLPLVREAMYTAYYHGWQARRGEVTPPKAPEIRADLDAAWGLYHNASRYRAALGDVLPRLITGAVGGLEVAVDRPAAAALLTETYVLGAHWLHAVGATDLMWLAAERAMVASRDAEDRATMTLGTWQVCWTLNTLGRSEDALDFGTRGAALVEPHLPDGSDEELAAWGILQLQCAIAAARCSDAALAQSRWEWAEEVVRRLPRGYVHRWHSFGLANLGSYAIAVPVELGNPGAALKAADMFDPLGLPTRQRRSRALVDVARGYVGRHEDVAALHVLERAESESADTAAGNILVHEMVREMLRRCRGTAETEVRGFARRIGLLAEHGD